MKRSPSLLHLPSLFLLTVVLLGQLMLQAHALGHALHLDQDSCEVCLLTDHHAALLSATPPGNQLARPRRHSAQPGSSQSHTALYHYDSRAPPFA